MKKLVKTDEFFSTFTFLSSYRRHDFFVDLVLRLGPIHLFDLVSIDYDLGGYEAAASQSSGAVVLVFDEGVLPWPGPVVGRGVKNYLAHTFGQGLDLSLPRQEKNIS